MAGNEIGKYIRKINLSPFLKKDNTDGAPGQLMKDVITTMKNRVEDGGKIRWEFPDPKIDRESLKKAVREKMKDDTRLREYVARAMGRKADDFSLEEAKFFESLDEILGGI
ncbi:MAG: hypothetical protein ACRCTL_09410 [Pseudomonas sp.]